MYQPLLTPVYWVRSIYMELLHASSRLRKDTRIETARPSNGLVKIMCSPKAQGEEPLNATAHNKGLTHWLGSASHAQSLYVWVPAHRAPCVCAVVKARTARFDAQRDQELLSARAWGQRIQLTIVLPSLKDWQTTLLRCTSCWPFRLRQEMTPLQPPSKSTFMRLRKRGQSKHILGGLDINWKLIGQHLWTSGPSVLTRDELERQLSLLRNSSTAETIYRGHDRDKWKLWTQQRDLVWMNKATAPAQMTLRMSSWILWGRTNYQAYLDWLEHLEQQQTQSGRFKTKKGYWVVKRRPQT